MINIDTKAAPRIESHTGFQPLKEVWIGDCYPVEFYNDFDSKSQDIFCTITEITRGDLNRLEAKLQELDVKTCRPVFESKHLFLDEQDNLIKPPISPRDWAMVLGDTLYLVPQYHSANEPYQPHIDRYRDAGQKVQILDRSRPDSMVYVEFPSVVRIGRDIFMDGAKRDPFVYQHFLECVHDLSEHYRVHVTHTGDHSDGCFCPIAPGQIFSTHYKHTYEHTFPEWKVFWLPDTTKKRGNAQPGSWWAPGINYSIYHDSITRKGMNWIGDSRETVFEVNMLVVDDKNVICIAEDDTACRKMESMGITPHVIDFRGRGFWDGGIHCITLDIHREGSCLDYWPSSRQGTGIYFY